MQLKKEKVGEIRKGLIMVWHKKQNNIEDMVANKKEVKVKEEGVDNMKKERERQKKVVDAKEEEKQKKEEEKKRKEKEEEKRKEKKKQMDKEKEKKHKAGKDKEAKDKEEKEKAVRDNEVKNKGEKEKARKDKEAKDKEEKERKDKEAKDKEEKARKDNEAKVKEEKEKARKDKEKNAKEEKENKGKEKEEEGEQKQRKEKEEEKKEREEKDKNDKNIYPHFYKVVIPEQSKEQLRIPLAFNKYLEDESPGVVSLKGPSGNIWRVELVANSEELCFVHGWKEFVSDHRIKLGYFLVFRYDGPSEFSVQVFDQTACETQYAFFAQPQNDVVVEDDEEDIGSNVDGASQDAIGDMGSDASDTSEEDDEWHMGSDDALDTSQDDQGDMDNNADGTSQANDTGMGIGAINTAETLVLQDNTGTMTKGSRKRRFRRVDELMANVYPSKMYKAEDKMSGASSGACKEVASSPSNSFEDSVTSKLVTSNEKPSYDKLDRLRSTLLNKSNDAPRPSKVLVTKVQRRPRLISQRRPITEKEKDHAVEQATDFKSKRPFTWKIMKYCEVYTSYFMVIPYSFVQKYLPKYNMKMTLWDPQGKSWRVSYVYFSDRSSGAFSAGWGAFAVGNNLEKFDACVFELLDKSYNIKVHIYRVVREIMPCILRSDGNR